MNTTISMDATGVKTSVAGFANICNTAVSKSKLSLTGHVSGSAYLLALTNSVSASTGVDIKNWNLGGQFEVNSRGAEFLPAAFLSVQRRHLSQTPATELFNELSHRATYSAFAGDVEEALSGARSAADDISAEQITPKRPTCLLSHSVPTKQACEMIVALTGLETSASYARVLHVIQNADTQALMSLAALLGVVPGTDPDAYEAALVVAIIEVFAAVRASPSTPTRVSRSPVDMDLKALGRSLRDEAAADDVVRFVVASMSSTRALLRLTVKALIRRKLVAKVFIPAETLPARVLLQLQSHVLLQDAVHEIVKNSVKEGGTAASGPPSVILSERVAAMDVYLAEQIDGGLMCHFTPLEAMYGIFSIGSMAALVATFKYVPGLAPAVTTLLSAARTLHFGGKGKSHPVDFRSSYSVFVDALHEVDRSDLVFDIKSVVNYLVDALDKKGPRGSQMWDDTLLVALRKKNELLQSQFAVRDDLDVLLRSLTVMKRYQEDFNSLRHPVEAYPVPDVVYVATSLHAASSSAALMAEELACDDDSLDVCRVGFSQGRAVETRRCKSGAHEIPTYIDFCGECGEFLDNIVVCPICKSPTKRSEKPDLQLCRGRFNLVPCNAENKPLRHKGFRVPTGEDITNAKERYRRLKEREVQRSSGSYRAFTVTLQNVPPAAEAGLPQTSNLAPMPVSDPPALGVGGRL